MRTAPFRRLFVVFAAAAICLVPGLGCRPGPTAIVVEVALALRPERSVDSLEVRVLSGTPQGVVHIPGVRASEPGKRVALVSERTSDRPVQIEVVALTAAGAPIVALKAETRFSPREVRLLRLELREDCVEPSKGCSATQSCERGVCGAVRRYRPQDLPIFTGAMPTATPDLGPRDAAGAGGPADASARDDGPADAPARDDAPPAAADARGTSVDGPPAAPDARPRPDVGREPPSIPPEPLFEFCPSVVCGDRYNHACCGGWTAYAWKKTPDGEKKRRELIERFWSTGFEAGATFAFQADDEVGTLEMRLKSPPRPLRAVHVRVAVTGTIAGPPLASLEEIGGESGCLYTIDADDTLVLDPPLSCWGSPSFEPYGLSVRVRSSGPGAVTLRVTGVAIF